ncbi:hypothetical protein [Viridibacillus arvi]|uniref:Uncharacterized protein n=1 Tax=Viridibacillus arvi TaxID=263475 RepID=A0A0M0LK30_9BACL|nr:hypothetical protein [Viridibacillus arvi]KOO51053.1 hypothetical protein AMD00_00615 [Viridibacillus arvi]
MMKKYSLFYIFSIVIGISIMNGTLEWLNIPTYDRLLEMILGKPNTLNRVIAITITGVLIYIIIKGVPKLKKI